MTELDSSIEMMDVLCYGNFNCLLPTATVISLKMSLLGMSLSEEEGKIVANLLSTFTVPHNCWQLSSMTESDRVKILMICLRDADLLRAEISLGSVSQPPPPPVEVKAAFPPFILFFF